MTLNIICCVPVEMTDRVSTLKRGARAARSFVPLEIYGHELVIFFFFFRNLTSLEAWNISTDVRASKQKNVFSVSDLRTYVRLSPATTLN